MYLLFTAVRKLKEKRRTVEGKLERREIVQDYSNYDSQTYAPMSRVGVFLDRGSEQYNVKSYHLNTYQGLLELEASLPDFVTQPRIQAPKPKSSGKGGFVKRKQRRQRELEEVANVIELAKRPPEPEKPLKFLVKVEKPIPRPPTPSVQVPSQVKRSALFFNLCSARAVFYCFSRKMQKTLTIFAQKHVGNVCYIGFT